MLIRTPQPAARVSARRASRLLRAGAAVVLMALVAGLAGCGLKTRPRPVAEVLPPTEGVRVFQRESDVWVSWQPMPVRTATRFGGVKGYRLVLERSPLFCTECPPEQRGQVTLAATDKALVFEAGRYFFRLADQQAAPAGFLLKVGVVTLFGRGENVSTRPALLEPAGTIPAPLLMWRPDAGGERLGRFFWTPVREGVEMVIGKDGRPRRRERTFRANLYRRTRDRWPMHPQNAQPLTADHWVVGATGGGEYRLRWVDRFGNEGPPSAVLRVSSGKEGG